MVVALFVGAIVSLILAVGYSLYADVRQSDDIGDIRIETSACRVAPQGIECRIGHANSVLLTTPEEACFILAQGGIECRAPLKNADAIANDLRQSVSEAPEPSTLLEPFTSGAPAPAEIPSTDEPAMIVAPISPPTELPDKPDPDPPAKPTPEPSAPAPTPTQPQPQAVRPLIDTPDELGLCVTAVGVNAVC